MQRKLSYLIVVGVALLSIVFAPDTGAARLYLEQDTVFITSGIGTEFDLELRVDADVQDLKLFIAEIDFDPGKLDTVSVTEGDFWDGSGGLTVFGYYLQNNDSLLRLENLVMGAGISADGPGLLATIRLKVVDTGAVDLSFHYYLLKDVHGDPIAAETSGTIVLINYPPLPFDLLLPQSIDTVNRFPGETFQCDWRPTSSVYIGESVKYQLKLSPTDDFLPWSTVTLDDLVDTTGVVAVDDILSWLGPEPATIYWKVTAIGQTYFFKRPSTPTPGTFTFELCSLEPGECDLVLPADSAVIDTKNHSDIHFDWEDSYSLLPGDVMKYILYVGPADTYPASAVAVDSTVDISVLDIPSDYFPVGQWQSWQVEVINTFDIHVWSTSIGTTIFFVRGDANGDGKTNISDVTFLIKYLFGIPSGPAPVPFIAGDMNCSESVNISDVTFVVEYLFGIPLGPEPYCPE